MVESKKLTFRIRNNNVTTVGMRKKHVITNCNKSVIATLRKRTYYMLIHFTMRNYIAMSYLWK